MKYFILFLLLLPQIVFAHSGGNIIDTVRHNPFSLIAAVGIVLVLIFLIRAAR